MSARKVTPSKKKGAVRKTRVGPRKASPRKASKARVQAVECPKEETALQIFERLVSKVEENVQSRLTKAEEALTDAFEGFNHLMGEIRDDLLERSEKIRQRKKENGEH